MQRSIGRLSPARRRRYLAKLATAAMQLALFQAGATVCSAADGSFDPTWAQGGRLVFPGDPHYSNNGSAVYQIVREGNGRLLLGGSEYSTPDTADTSSWFVGELFPDGTLVPTFGASNGSGTVSGCYLTASLCTQSTYFSGFVMTADAEIDIATPYSESRLTSGGHALDAVSVAGGNGFVVSTPVQINDVKGSFLESEAIARTADGKWLLAGFGHYSQASTDLDFAIIRLNTDFSFDASFNAQMDDKGVTFAGGQIVSFNLGGNNDDLATEILVQQDGRIVLVGSAGDATGIVRLNPDGTLDTSFGAGTGKTVINWSLGTMLPASLPGSAKQDGEGRLLLAGYATLTGAVDTGMAVARVLANGTLDSTFGSNGVSDYLPAICPYGAEAIALALDSAGRIVVAGNCGGSGAQTVFLLERLHGDDGSIDSQFGVNGFSDGQFSASSTFDSANDVLFDASGRPVFAGWSYVSGVSMAAIARLTYDLIYTNNFEASPPGRLRGQ